MPKKHKIQKIQVRNRKGSENNISIGANMEVLLDGKRINGAYAVKFEVTSKSVAKVTIELFAEVEIDANVNLQESKVGQTLLEGKTVNRHTISNYAPMAIDQEE